MSGASRPSSSLTSGVRRIVPAMRPRALRTSSSVIGRTGASAIGELSSTPANAALCGATQCSAGHRILYAAFQGRTSPRTPPERLRGMFQLGTWLVDEPDFDALRGHLAGFYDDRLGGPHQALLGDAVVDQGLFDQMNAGLGDGRIIAGGGLGARA